MCVCVCELELHERNITYLNCLWTGNTYNNHKINGNISQFYRKKSHIFMILLLHLVISCFNKVLNSICVNGNMRR